MTDVASGSARLTGWWKFDDGTAGAVADASDNGHKLTATGGPRRSEFGANGGAVALDGATQWFSSARPVLCTSENFSIAAWIRLDSATMNGDVQLPPGGYAVTAVSQDGPSHSPFYLGARMIEVNGSAGTGGGVLRWDFTVAPVDGSVTGTIEWPHTSTEPIDRSMLDQWVLLVAVFDRSAHRARLFVPGFGDSATAQLPEEWPFWNAEGPLRLGQARYLDNVVDHWPGSIGPVRTYSGVLTAADAAALYEEEAPTGQ